MHAGALGGISIRAPRAERSEVEGRTASRNRLSGGKRPPREWGEFEIRNREEGEVHFGESCA